jgi:hypothetical protein
MKPLTGGLPCIARRATPGPPTHDHAEYVPATDVRADAD